MIDRKPRPRHSNDHQGRSRKRERAFLFAEDSRNFPGTNFCQIDREWRRKSDLRTKKAMILFHVERPRVSREFQNAFEVDSSRTPLGMLSKRLYYASEIDNCRAAYRMYDSKSATFRTCTSGVLSQVWRNLRERKLDGMMKSQIILRDKQPRMFMQIC